MSYGGGQSSWQVDTGSFPSSDKSQPTEASAKGTCSVLGEGEVTRYLEESFWWENQYYDY